MGRRFWNRLGVFLIVLSFIFMGSGLLVAYKDHDFIFGKYSAIVSNVNKNNINISTVNGEGPEGLSSVVDSNQGNNSDIKLENNNDKEVKEEKNPTNVGENKSEVLPDNSNNNDNKTDSSNNNSSDNITSGENVVPPVVDNSNNGSIDVDTNKENVTPEEPTVDNNPSEPVVPTIEETNINLRNEIQNQYGISVKYGSETAGYNVGGMSTTQITDPNVVKKALEDMKSTISLFPVGIWNEMKSSGYPLTIYLIGNYSSTNVTGVTESFSNRVTISIATKFSFGETFNHEVFHYFENFITQFRGANFNEWNSFNPANFGYGSVNSSLSYTRTFSADSYFVNDYAQTQDAEDRASTFEYMMFDAKAACLNRDKPVWKKAKYMADQLDNYLNSVSPNVVEYWERHL